MPVKRVYKKLSVKTKKSRFKPSVINYDFVSDTIVRQAAEILGRLNGQRILVCAGKGNTGAVGIAAAAKLILDGARPQILLAETPDDLGEDAKLFLKQAEILRIPIQQWTANLPGSVYRQQDLVVDALLGAATLGDPRYTISQIITAINDSRVPVLALDVPSGLDPKTGRPGSPTVVAMVTLQITVPTKNLLNQENALYVGRVVSLPRH